MSTVQRTNFEPVSDIASVHRRDFPLADPTLANPLNALCLVDGEWMTLDDTSGPTQGKLIRATTVGTPGNPAAKHSFPLWMERGRYDVQAMSEKKAPLIYMGQYEFNTRIYDATTVIGSGAAITTLLQPVKVVTITLGGRNYTGLVGSAYNDTVPIVGYVTRLPAANGQQLRFMSGWAVRNGTT